MNNGVVLFAHNTENYDYFEMAVCCAKRVNHFLNLPVTLISDHVTLHDKDTKLFDNVFTVETNKSNQNRNKIWINKGRFRAYELSPYDKTILLDVDYVINSTQLLKTLDFVVDICAHRNTQYIDSYKSNQEFLSTYSHQTFWATVIVYKKTLKSKLVFDSLKMIENNYSHYGILHNFLYQQYRNDYGLTLALDLVNGHVFDESDVIPWNLIHVQNANRFYKNNGDEFCNEYTTIFDKVYNGRTKTEYLTISDMDFHMLDKNKLLELFQ